MERWLASRLLTDDILSVVRSLRLPVGWLAAQLATLIPMENAPDMDRGCLSAMRKVMEKAKELAEAINEHEREAALWREVKTATEEAKADNGKGLSS